MSNISILSIILLYVRRYFFHRLDIIAIGSQSREAKVYWRVVWYIYHTHHSKTIVRKKKKQQNFTLFILVQKRILPFILFLLLYIWIVTHRLEAEKERGGWVGQRKRKNRITYVQAFFFIHFLPPDLYTVFFFTCVFSLPHSSYWIGRMANYIMHTMVSFAHCTYVLCMCVTALNIIQKPIKYERFLLLLVFVAALCCRMFVFLLWPLLCINAIFMRNGSFFCTKCRRQPSIRVLLFRIFLTFIKHSIIFKFFGRWSHSVCTRFTHSHTTHKNMQWSNSENFVKYSVSLQPVVVPNSVVFKTRLPRSFVTQESLMVAHFFQC